jgi:hypothetical protein
MTKSGLLITSAIVGLAFVYRLEFDQFLPKKCRFSVKFGNFRSHLGYSVFVAGRIDENDHNPFSQILDTFLSPGGAAETCDVRRLRSGSRDCYYSSVIVWLHTTLESQGTTDDRTSRYGVK